MKRLSSSEIFLIVANLAPILGIFFFDWSLFSVLIAYWVETGVVFLYALAKRIYTVRNSKRKEDRSEALASIFTAVAAYGSFIIIHFALILDLAYPGINNTLSGVFKEYINEIGLMIVVFFISHGQSFYINFIKNRESEKIEVKELLFDDIKNVLNRFLLMQLIVLAGFYLLEFTNGSIYLYAIFIFAKIVVDLNAHRRKHELESYKSFIPDPNTPKPLYVPPNSY
ncbi:MAG TPA: DUF6498-containing protein [Candidatus Pacearchaeota archaeon]|nr:DUF6498-containing protein [Candidatus Pacearchaeota archaeon]